jgi:type II secretory pathway predicted ATPase ExeA
MYETYFGLSARPFQLNPDPGFHFWSNSHLAADVFLAECAARRQGVTVLSGEIGAGKTTLVAARLAALDPNTVAVGQLVSSQLDVKGLLHATALAFELPLRSAARAQILAAIETFLLGLLPSGRCALLVVDEAQNLTAEALNAVFLLSTYPPGHRPVLQFLLLGQPELRDRIRENRAGEAPAGAVAEFHLGPLEEHETRAYIEHRLAHVGWKQDPRISPSAFARIFAATGGVPRRVNGVCNRLLLSAYLAREHDIDAPDVDEVVEELRNEIGDDVLPAAADVPLAAPRLDRPRADPAQAQLITALTARLDKLERQAGVMLKLARAMPAAPQRAAANRPKSRA